MSIGLVIHIFNYEWAYHRSFEATVTVKMKDGRVIEEISDQLSTKKAAEFQAADRALNSLLAE